MQAPLVKSPVKVRQRRHGRVVNMRNHAVADRKHRHLPYWLVEPKIWQTEIGSFRGLR